MGRNNPLLNDKWQHVNIEHVLDKPNFDSFKGGKRKERYLICDHLLIKIDENVFTYPPKAGALIFNQDFTKVLCVLNNYNPKKSKWGLPKGHLEIGKEQRHECAKRELFEETGLDININYDDPFIKINNSIYYVFSVNESIIEKLKPIDTKEIKKIEFIDISLHKNLNINKEMKVALTRKLRIAKKISKKLVI